MNQPLFPGPRLPVHDALRQRRSIRAYLPQAVDRAVIERILAVAARAPSGNNIQPWRVLVLQGDAITRLAAAVQDFRAAHPGQENWGYQYYPRAWRDPYLARRRKVGWDMYSLLGITRQDHDKMQMQQERNFSFFGAPVGMLFTIDADMAQGSWLDCGLFIQSVVLAAQAEGLGTCLQAAWVAHEDVVAKAVGLPASQRLVCGMALGHPDPAAAINTLETERVPVAQFASFLGEPA